MDAVLLCFLIVLVAQATGKVAVSAHPTDWDSTSVLEEIAETGNTECQCDAILQEMSCYCGPKSKGCKIENCKKVCKCDYPYTQENGICKGRCHKRWHCDHGGKCVNGSCQCLPGTSGDFCERVDACAGVKGPFLCGDPDEVLCRYDEKTQRPYCMCRIYEYAYYPKTRRCVECDCGEHGTCSLVDGKKQCKCDEDAALRKEAYFGDGTGKCHDCKCGNNSDGCSFDGYKKICNCRKGFAQQPVIYGHTCSECNCGPHGQCYFRGWYKYCNCDEGYKPFLYENGTELTCKACNCGENGVCSFEDEVKQCKCNPGYDERDGVCTD